MKNRKNMFRALALTLIQLFGILLFFEPTEKSDDYDMCCYLYGAYNGIPDYHLLYIGVLLGKILQGLVIKFPNIPWYIVYQYACIFCCFYVINYFLVKKNLLDYKKNFLNYFFVFAFAYEFYIRFTFTKVAGLLAVVGMLLLAEVVYNSEKCILILPGILFILNALCLRFNIILIVLFLFGSTYVVFLVENRHRYGEKTFWKTTLTLIGITTLLYVGYQCFVQLDRLEYNQTAEWSNFKTTNTVRAQVFDYGIPNYNQYADDYERLGVSKTDYEMWFKDANYSDREVLTDDLLVKIREIQPIKDKGIIVKIIKGIRNLLGYSLNKIMTLIYLSIALMYFLNCDKKSKGGVHVSIVSAFMVMAYLILYIKGRVQHHVDVVIIICGIVLILFYDRKQEKSGSISYRRLGCECIILCVLVNVFYGSMTNSSYYQEIPGDETSYRQKVEENYKKLKLISDDKDTLYLIGALETTNGFPAFAITSESIERGFYSNIFRMNEYAGANYEYMLAQYVPDGRGLYECIVDNPNIRYYVSEAQLDKSDTIARYLSEHYKPNTKAQLVREIDGAKVYRFVSDSICLPDDCDVSENIKSDVNIESNPKYITIDGYAYLQGKDSFAQDVYIEVYNKLTQEKNTYSTLQTINENLYNQTKYDGRYSNFKVKIPAFDEKICEVSLVLEYENHYYKKTLGVD